MNQRVAGPTCGGGRTASGCLEDTRPFEKKGDAVEMWVQYWSGRSAQLDSGSNPSHRGHQRRARRGSEFMSFGIDSSVPWYMVMLMSLLCVHELLLTS